MNLHSMPWPEVDNHIAAFISARLANAVRSKTQGYRMALTDLSRALLMGIAQQLCDTDLPRGTRVVVLGDVTEGDLIVSPTRLIEMRNDEEGVPILVVLIPTRFRSYAEDSYAEHNFAAEDPESLLRACRDELLRELAREGFPAAHSIMRRARVVQIEAEIRYLLSVSRAGPDWQIFGALLPLLGLTPDLELDPANLDARLLDNANKVNVLVDPTLPLTDRVDRLNLTREDVKSGLLHLFTIYDPRDVEAWGQAIVQEALALKVQNRAEQRLSYDNWIDSEDGRPHCELEILPLSRGNPVDEEGHVNVTTNDKIKVQWRWQCTPPQEVRFIIRGYRDEEEVFSSGSIPHNQSTKTVNLRGKGLDEGQCHLQMESIGPEGRVLDVAESEPFWIVGEDEPPLEVIAAREPKWGDEVHSLAEAHCLAAMKLGRHAMPQEVLWQARSRRAPVDTLKIRYSRATVYHVRLSAMLREFECTVLLNPRQAALWHLRQSDPGSEEVEYEPASIDLGSLPDVLYKGFREARDDLFEKLRCQNRPGAGEGFTNVIETADLLALRAEVVSYLRMYVAVLQHYSRAQDGLNLLRALALDALVRGDEVILSPLHPLKLAWALQCQALLYMVSVEAVKGGKSQGTPYQTLFQLLTSINYPPFAPGPDGQMRVNAGQLHLLWSTFSTDPTQYHRVADWLKRVLRLAGGGGAEEAVQPQGLYQRINRYLQLHPFIRQFKLGVINPGDGATVLEVLRTIQREWSSRDLKYDLAFFAYEEPDQAATALDRLMAEEDESKKRSEDDELTECHTSLMSPKLVYAKHPVEAYYDEGDDPLHHHVFVLLDAFKTELGSLTTRSERSGSFLGHLMNDLVSHFEASQDHVYWAHTVVPQSAPDVPALAAVTTLMAEVLEAYMQGCGLLLSGNADRWPAVYLPIREQERKLIVLAHQRADWVMFVDRYFDIDFLDHPNSPFCEYYLVDYVPTGQAGMGHNLIVSTASTIELQRLVAQELNALALPIDAAPDIVDALQAMSGRLAIRQLSTRNLVREAIGLTLLWMDLKEAGRLTNAVFLPIDLHLDLFTGGLSGAQVESQQRTDIMIVTLNPEGTALNITLIESKLRSSLGAEAFVQLKAYIGDQLDRTHKNLITLLRPGEQPLDVFRLMAWHDFKTLLLFYLQRACRHYLVDDELVARWKAALGRLPAYEMGVHFDKEAYVFNLSFAGRDEETISSSVRLYHIGHDEIQRLLSARTVDEEIEADTGPQEPSSEVGAGLSAVGQDLKVEQRPLVTITQQEEVEEVHTETLEKPARLPEGASAYLGESTYDHRPICWEPFRTQPRRLTNPHVLIVGTSGAGKTQTTMAFLHGLWQHQVPSLILDFHGEYANPEADTFRALSQAQVVNAVDGIPVNPLEIPLDPYRRPVNPKRVVWEVSEIIGQILRVGLQQQRALKRAIEKAYQHAGFTSDQKTWTRRAPSFRAIHDILKDEESTGGSVVSTLLSRLDVLFDADVFSDHPSQRLEELLRQVTVVDLSGLFNNEHRLVVARFFLQKIYNQMLMLGETRDLRLFVTVDEAHRLSYDETLLKLIKEARKYGIGILLASQEPADFPATALELPGTRIFLQQGPRGAKTIASHLEPTDLKRRHVLEGELQNLDVGEAYVRSNHFVPFEKVRIKFFYQRVGSA
jgi:DNA helicase HerA-like ATPase